MLRPMLPLALLTALALSVPAVAADPATGEFAKPDAAGTEMEIVAIEMDTNRDGVISTLEIDRTGRAIFASMDVDGSDALSRDEMLHWEYGMSEMAAYRGRVQAFDATMGMVFDMFDRNGNGAIDAAEHAAGVAMSRQQADLDGDGVLTPAEFNESFLVTIALRNAMTLPE